MVGSTKGLKKYAEEKTIRTLEKVDKAIRAISLNGDRINFNSVTIVSGVSKTFLYKNKEVKSRIENLRERQVSSEINKRAKYDKTSKAKDIIILAKDKKIKEMEEKNKKLEEQLELLRGKLYDKV